MRIVNIVQVDLLELFVALNGEICIPFSLGYSAKHSAYLC